MKIIDLKCADLFWNVKGITADQKQFIVGVDPEDDSGSPVYLQFTHLYDNQYDLTAVYDFAAKKAYVEIPEDKDCKKACLYRMTEWSVSCGIDEEFVFDEFKSLADIELITSCGGMGTVISIKGVWAKDKDEAVFHLAFDDVVYLESRESIPFVGKKGGMYYLYNDNGNLIAFDRNSWRTKVTTEMIESVRV